MSDMLGMKDPRSLQGMMARGANIYQGVSHSPYAGKATMDSMNMAKMMPEYKKLSMQDVARKVLMGG